MSVWRLCDKITRKGDPDRDASRQQWLLAADTWQLAIEFEARVDHLTAEWASIKRAAAGKAISADRSQDPVNRPPN
jgi:hypothetical protein